MAEPQSLEGGCLCGAVRYRLRGEPIVAALCHCSMCRRAAGAPVVAFALFAQSALEWTQGRPAIYPSSPGVERGFCGRCGTSLTFAADFIPDLVDVTIASLDEPTRLPPHMHVWESERIPWLALADGLPRHAQLPPQDEVAG